MEFEQVVRDRSSVKTYEPGHELNDDVLRHLFELTVRSPSSYNLQHWRFIVVRDRERRQQLMDASFGQSQVGEASVTVVVAGKLDAHEDAPRIYASAPEAVRDQLVPMIERAYANDPQLQRDEVMRSASLAAMTLMLAAVSEGLATCPMIGFEPRRVAELVGLDDRHVPVMLLTLGRPRGKARVSDRLPLGDVVTFERLGGPALA